MAARGETFDDVYFSGGKIVGLGENPHPNAEVEVIDVAGKYVVPGFIDGHVHLREMGYSDREDFYSGTQAAAVGGITTVMDMPNSKPNVITPDDFKARRDRVFERAYVNIGLYVWACAKNADRLKDFAELGPVGFKIFTAETGAYDPEFSSYITTEPAVLCRILREIGEMNSLAAIHSESQALISHFEEQAKKTLPPDMRAYLHSRPQAVEDVAVFTEVAIARQMQARIHICHVVGKGAVDFLRWAKSSYHPHVSCEAAPHNLLMNSEQTARLGSVAKFSPPVHGEEHRAALWQGLTDGTIDIIGSDHAPQDYEKKHNPNIWQASPGSPALDYWVPLMLDRVARNELSLRRFVEAAAEKPAKIFGIFPRKGSIEVGADADLVVIDMEKTSVVDPTRFKSKARYSAFEGWPLRGMPVMTFVNGSLVAQDGEIVGKPGTGTLVIPAR
jgi:dihydroorotase (multifunctional complex type)